MTSDQMENKVVIYGSDWCPFTVRALQLLEAWKVDYQWIDVDAEPAAEKQIADCNNGRAIRPTFDIGGVILVNPDQSILHDELESRGLVDT